RGAYFDDTYTITPTTVTRDSAAPINYGTIEDLNVWASSGNDTFLVKGTSATAPVTLAGDVGDDTFKVGSADDSGSLDSIAGALWLDGGWSGTDRVMLDDRRATSAVAYTIDDTSITRTGATIIYHAYMDSIELSGGNFNDEINARDLTLPSTLHGGAGDDVL